jgi:predicted nucleic acid-binding protein
LIVVDTTVLVYAKGTGHELREPCFQLMEAVATGDVRATTTVEAVQEFAHVRARRRGRQDAVELAAAYADLLSPLLIVEERDLLEGLRLFERNNRLGPFDAVLAAAARSIDAQALVSADRAFSTVPRLRHVFPDSKGVAALLGHT